MLKDINIPNTCIYKLYLDFFLFPISLLIKTKSVKLAQAPPLEGAVRCLIGTLHLDKLR